MQCWGDTDGRQSREAHVLLSGYLLIRLCGVFSPQQRGEGIKQLSHEILVSGAGRGVTDLILGTGPVVSLQVIEDALPQSEDRLFSSKCIRLSPDLWDGIR